jgi:hypothetical protein
MSFWNLNDGSSVENNGVYELGGGDIEPIPGNTGCIAAIEEAKWDEYNEDRFISLKWRVMKPDEFAKRVIFQKVKVFGTSRDKDPQATADKAKRMLAAVDQNAGGKLMKVQGEPSDTDLMTALVGKVMAIKVQIWERDKDDNGQVIPKDERKRGNWVSAVSPAKGSAAKAAKEAPKAKEPEPEEIDDIDDDVPF